MLILAICGKFDDKLLKFEKRKNIATKIIETNIPRHNPFLKDFFLFSSKNLPI